MLDLLEDYCTYKVLGGYCLINIVVSGVDCFRYNIQLVFLFLRIGSMKGLMARLVVLKDKFG